MRLQCPYCHEQYYIQSAQFDPATFRVQCTKCGTSMTAENIIGDQVMADYPRKRRSPLLWILLAVMGIVMGLLVITRPPKSMHAEKVKELSMGLMTKAVATEDDMSKGLAMLLGPYLVDRFIDVGLQVDDYFFFNVGRIRYEDVDKPISIGILNNVILLVDNQQIEEAYEKSKRELEETPM